MIKVIIIIILTVGATRWVAHDVCDILNFREMQTNGRAIQINGRATHRVAPTVAGSIATKRINKLHGTSCLTIWQRNYHDHIIRNDDEYGRICEYIVMNPENWCKDVENLK